MGFFPLWGSFRKFNIGTDSCDCRRVLYAQTPICFPTVMRLAHLQAPGVRRLFSTFKNTTQSQQLPEAIFIHPAGFMCAVCLSVRSF